LKIDVNKDKPTMPRGNWIEKKAGELGISACAKLDNNYEIQIFGAKAVFQRRR